MSWKTAGKLVSGPPIASSSAATSSIRHRPNLGGLNAFQREQEFASHYSSSRKGKEPEIQGRTDYDVLKENHRFIRDDEEAGEVSWEERLARAYESKLFKEFALIDLKHYKSRRLALRWRTAEEVVEGLGEDTCGSLRCKYHPALATSSTSNRVELDDDDENEYDSRRKRRTSKIPPLRAFELPFVYQEAGERKEALVKVRLCRRCEGKLTWKPGREIVDDASSDEETESRRRRRDRDNEDNARRRDKGREGKNTGGGGKGDKRLQSRSRSRSPLPSHHRSGRREKERRLI